jgi:hypothetical protein
MRLNTPVRVTLRFDGEDSTYNYVGEAPVGTQESDPYWRIYRLTNTGTASLKKDYADNSDLFNKVWASRATYTY